MTDHELNTIKAIREALPAPEKRLADDIAGIIRGLRTECDRLNGIQGEHRDLFARHVDYVRHFADTRRIIAWLDNPKRPPANTAFTSGPDRQMAYRFEALFASIFVGGVRPATPVPPTDREVARKYFEALSTALDSLYAFERGRNSPMCHDFTLHVMLDDGNVDDGTVNFMDAEVTRRVGKHPTAISDVERAIVNIFKAFNAHDREFILNGYIIEADGRYIGPKQHP